MTDFGPREIAVMTWCAFVVFWGGVLCLVLMALASPLYLVDLVRSRMKEDDHG